jgi:hypothetical protein
MRRLVFILVLLGFLFGVAVECDSPVFGAQIWLTNSPPERQIDLKKATSYANTNFTELYNYMTNVSEALSTNSAVGKLDQTNGVAVNVRGTITKAIVNGVIDPTHASYGALGDLNVTTGAGTDDQLGIQASINAAGTNVIRFPPNKAFKVSGTLWITNSNITIDGNNSTIWGSSDVRLITVSNAHNVSIKNFVLQGLTNGTTQAALRFENATNCTYQNIVSRYSGLNAFEITHSKGIHGEGNMAYKPKSFGWFYFMTTDSSDAHTVIEEPTSFAYEFKDSKRCFGRQVDIINPLAEYALYFWTGYGTGPEVPGDMLTEDCGVYDLYVEGGANTKTLAYFNASRRCFVRGAYLKPAIDGAWGVADINGSFFYNELLTMTGDAVQGATNLVNVTHASQLNVGDRIHIAGSATNHTVYSVSGTTVRLTATNDITAASALIGWVAKPDFTDLQDVTILGWGDDAVTMINSIQIGGTAGDRIEGVYLKNVNVESSGNYALNVAHASFRAEGGSYRHSAGGREWNLDTGAIAEASKVLFQSKTNFSSYGAYLRNGAQFAGTDCDFQDFGITAISPGAAGDNIYLKGGTIQNVLQAPLLIYANSSVIGTRFLTNQFDLGSFDAELRVYGTNNSVGFCTFNPGGSVWIANHIAEQTGATGNQYGLNNYMGGLENDVALASGSTSTRINPLDSRLNRLTVTVLTNTGILTGIVGTDANGKEKKVTLSGASYDGTTLTVTGGGGTAVYANAASVSNPNFADSATATIAVGASTNITVNPTNIANAQISGSAAIVKTKLENSAALSVVGRSANSSGAVADIAAASDGQVLRRSGTAIGFGAVDLASANAVTGVLPAANIDSAQATDVEVATLLAGYQPLDADLTGIATGTPGNSKYFGTDGTGAKGFYDLPAGAQGSAFINGTNINDINFTDGASIVLVPNSSTNVSVSLVNDSATPGAGAYYGTDDGGVKGYFALPLSNWDADGLTDSFLDGSATITGDLDISGNLTVGATNVISGLAGKSPLFLNSSGLYALLNDPVGTGAAMFNISPPITTPTINSYMDIASRVDAPANSDGRIWNENGHVKVRSNGSTIDLSSVPAVAGSDTQVQYNNGGSFAGAQGLTIVGTNTFAAKVTITNDLNVLHEATIGTGNGSIDVGATGVNISSDGDGAVTFTGLGDGFDENLTLNLDDVSNTGTFTSSTGLNVINFSGIALQQSGSPVADSATTMTIAGTANEITSSAGAQSLAGNRTWTLSLPTAITLMGKTATGGTFLTPLIDDYAEFNEESAPSTPGSAKVRLYAKADGLLYSKDDAGTETLVSGGVGGGGGGTAGTMINSGTPVAGFVPAYGDGTGTNMVPSTGLSVSGTNVTSKGTFKANDVVTTNGVANVGTGAGVLYVKDAAAAHSFSFTPNASITTDANIIGPTAPFSGFPMYDTVTATTNMPLRQAVEGVDYRGLKVASGDTPITSAGFVDIAGLTFAVTSGNTYEFDGFVRFTTSTTAMGVLFGVNGPSLTTLCAQSRKQITVGGTASTDMFSEAILTAYDTPLPNSTSEAETAAQVWRVTGTIKCSASGTVALRMSKENVAGTATALTGSFLRWQKIL